MAVRLGCEDGMGTRRIVHWCGAQLQAPHRGVRELGYLPPSAGVFISRWHHGSPSHRCAWLLGTWNALHCDCMPTGADARRWLFLRRVCSTMRV